MFAINHKHILSLKMKIFYCLLTMCLFINFLPAEENISTYESKGVLDEILTCPIIDGFTFKVAYFRPESSRVRRIYSSGWADYQVEYSKSVCQNWLLWTGASGFCKHGHSIGLNDDTRLRLIPISLGVKYLYSIAPCLDLYAGGAVCYSFLRIKDDSPYVHRNVSSQTFGGLAQVGLYYYFTQSFHLNVFADYLFQRFTFPRSSSNPFVERNDLNMSGWKIGGGIGVNF